MNPKHLVVGKDYEMTTPRDTVVLFLREEEGHYSNYYYFRERDGVIRLSDHHVLGNIRERQFDESR